MSTGDDTLYLRSRLAERRGKPDYGGPGGQWSSPPQFMKDGFQKWAESTRPAREGGSEKIGCEKQMPRKGGLGPADLPKIFADMTQFYDQAKKYAPKVKETLRNKAVQKKITSVVKSQALKDKIVGVMEKIPEYMEMVGLGHMKGDQDMVRRVGGSKSFKDWCKEEGHEHSHKARKGKGGLEAMMVDKHGKLVPFEHNTDDDFYEGGRIGMGHPHMKRLHAMAKRHGGADASLTERLTKYGMEVYNWLKDNKDVTATVLNSKYLNEANPLGKTTVPKTIKKYMSMVGLGKVAGYEDCPPGYEDDGLTCRKMGTKKVKHAFGEFDMPDLDIKAKKMTGKGRHGGDAMSDMMSDIRSKVPKEDVSMKIKGGRAPSAYAMFVKKFAKSHPGPDLMKRAGAAWRSR